MFKNAYYAFYIELIHIANIHITSRIKVPNKLYKSNYFVIKDIIILKDLKNYSWLAFFNRLGINSDIPHRLTGNSQNAKKSLVECKNFSI